MDSLQVKITSVNGLVIFSHNKDEEYNRIEAPGIYQADLFIVAGTSYFRQSMGSGTVSGSGTAWLYCGEIWKHMPRLPDEVREIIRDAGIYTGGGGRSYSPGTYVLFNNRLFRTEEAAREHAKYLMGGSAYYTVR